MSVAILAPLPAVHLKSALQVCSASGRVAFGTNAWELFSKINNEYGVSLPVLIYPTHTYGDPDNLCDPGYASFHGTYLGLVSSKAGKHPNPSVRPAPTIQGPERDTPWACFWEVSSLTHLSKQDRIAITSLTAESQKKPLSSGFVPHGPMLVKAAFL